ncbi:MAG: GNAT family N-acetyltransferase [Myxococcota bacterium]
METLIFEQDDARQEAALISIAQSVFDRFDGGYIQDRLAYIADPMLIVAKESDQWLGFKMAYRRGSALYSWLGGTHPDARRRGIAKLLMQTQHQIAVERGYKAVLTRTRASNRSMIILNLKYGFDIVGFEVDSGGHPVATLRKSLKGDES